MKMKASDTGWPQMRSAHPARAWVAGVATALGCALGVAAPTVLAQTPEVKTSAASTAPAPRPAMIETLALEGFIKQVLVANNQIAAKKTAQQVAEAGIESADAIFQPVATFSTQTTRLKEQNTPEEEMLRSGLGIYERHNQEAEAGVGVLMPTGGRLEAKTSLARLNSNVTSQRRGTHESDYKSFYGVTLTQPLARDAGEEVTRSGVKVAELDAKAAHEALQESQLAVVSEAIAAYYDLVQAQQREQLWQDGIRMAEDLLVEARHLHNSGRLPESDIFDVESSLIRYQAGLNQARQSVLEQGNRLRSLAATSAQAGTPLLATDPMPTVALNGISHEESLRLAMQHRPDFQMNRTLLEREGVKIVYANNQVLPKVDLVASYGINGLELNADESMGNYSENSHYPAWTLGVQASMPIGTDRRAAAELRAAKLRKQEALLNLKTLETTLANDIDTSLAAIKSTYERWEMFRRIEAMEVRQVQAERERLRAGRSDMREVLTREELLINARTAVLEQAAAFAKAHVALDMAQGTLLQRFR